MAAISKLVDTMPLSCLAPATCLIDHERTTTMSWTIYSITLWRRWSSWWLRTMCWCTFTGLQTARTRRPFHGWRNATSCSIVALGSLWKVVISSIPRSGSSRSSGWLDRSSVPSSGVKWSTFRRSKSFTHSFPSNATRFPTKSWASMHVTLPSTHRAAPIPFKIS